MLYLNNLDIYLYTYKILLAYIITETSKKIHSISHTNIKFSRRKKKAMEQRGRRQGKEKTLKNAGESGSETESLVTDEIYDRLLAAEIDSLSKLIRNGVFYISRFVACFLYSKLRCVILSFFNLKIFSIILILIIYYYYNI